MAPVIWLPVVVAAVVATWVIRFGNTRCAQPLPCSRARPRPAAAAAPPPSGQVHGGASSQVSVTCSLYPSQNSPRLTPHRASVSYGEAIRIWPGGRPSPPGSFSRRLITSPATGDGPGVVLQQHPAQHPD